MKTATEYQASIAARNARFRAKRDAAGLVEVRVTTTAAAAEFIKELAARLRVPGADLEPTLADLLGVQRAPAPAAQPQHAAPPATPAPSVAAPTGWVKPDWQLAAEQRAEAAKR